MLAEMEPRARMKHLLGVMGVPKDAVLCEKLCGECRSWASCASKILRESGVDGREALRNLLERTGMNDPGIGITVQEVLGTGNPMLAFIMTSAILVKFAAESPGQVAEVDVRRE